VGVAAFCVAVAAIPIAVRLALPDAPRFTRTSYPVVRFELPRPRAGGLPIEFDLSARHAAADAGSPVEIVKPVEIDGVVAGEATVRVDAGSNLAISADELAGLLARTGYADIAARLPDGPFVSFEALRSLGLDVRYQAPSDRVLISL